MKKSILPATWQIPDELRDRLGDSSGRQRAMQADGHLLIVLHRVPQSSEDTRHGRFFWRKPDGTWSSNELGSGPQALVRHQEEFTRVLEHLDKLQEEACDAEDYFTVMHELEPVYRSTRNMQTALQQARTMVPEDRSIINFRDRAVELERRAELLESDTKNDMDLVIARRTEDQAKSSHQMSVSAHRLNILAAFFFPIATLSAIFGVNMRHGWENVPGPVPIFTLLGVGLLCGFLLSLFVTRKV